MTDPSTDPIRLKPVWVALLLLVVGAVYAPSLGNQFALDDGIVVRASLPSGAPNRMTSILRPIADYFSNGYWIGNDGELSPLFRPVTVWSYAITNSFTGGVRADPEWEALPHHLINVLLQVLATFLVLRMLAALVQRGWHALVGAAVFGLHAIHSEVVAGIVGRAELLGFCFGALSLLLFIHGRDRAGGVRVGLFIGSAGSLFLAFCSKESAVAWVPFLWVYGVIHHRIRHHPGGVLRTGMQVGALALIPLLTFLFLRHAALVDVPSPFPVDYLANPLHGAPLVTRWLTAISIWGVGLLKCVLPLNLVSDYGPVTFTLLRSPLELSFLLASVALVGFLAVGIQKLRTQPLIFLAAACFLGFSFLTSNLPFAIGTVFGERLYFTPSLGIALLVSWTASRVTRPWMVLVPVAAWLCMSCLVILDRNGAWFDETSLYVSDAQRNPRCLRLLEAYAGHLERLNRHERSEQVFREALDLQPDYLDALSGYGGFLARKNRFAEAEKIFLRALDAPQGLNRLRHITHYNLALLYLNLERPEQVRNHLRMAWRLDSAFATLHEPLLMQIHGQLPLDEVEKIVEKGEKRWPDHPTWPLQRAYLSLAYKDTESAIRSLRRARKLRPTHALTRWVLAATLLKSGDKAAAKPILEALRRDKSAPLDLRKRARTALRDAY